MDPIQQTRVGRVDKTVEASATSPADSRPEHNGRGEGPREGNRGVLSQSAAELAATLRENISTSPHLHDHHRGIHSGVHSESAAITRPATAEQAGIHSIPTVTSSSAPSTTSSIHSSVHNQTSTAETNQIHSSSSVQSTATTPAPASTIANQTPQPAPEPAKGPVTDEKTASLPTSAQQKIVAMLCELDPNHTIPSNDPRVRDIRHSQLDRCKDYQTVNAEAGKLSDVIDSLRKNLGQQELHGPMGEQLTKLKGELLQHLEQHQHYQQGLSQTRDELIASIRKLNDGMSFEKLGREFEIKHLPDKAQEYFNKAHASLIQANEILKHNPLAELLPGIKDSALGTQVNGQGKPLAQLLSPEAASALAATAVLAATQPAYWQQATLLGATHPGLVNGLAMSNTLGSAAVVTASDRVIDTAARPSILEQRSTAIAATAAALGVATAVTAEPQQPSFAAKAISTSNIYAAREQATQISAAAEQSARSELQTENRRAQIIAQQTNRRAAQTAAAAKNSAATVAKKSVLELMNSRVTKNRVIGGALAGSLAAIGVAATVSAPAFTTAAISSSTLALFGMAVGGAAGGGGGFSLGGLTIAGIGAALGALIGAGLGSQVRVRSPQFRKR